VGIFEVWRLTTEGRTLILHGADEPTLNRHVLVTGTRTLLLDALDKVASGLTALSEIRPLCRQGVMAAQAP
jgi:type II secretory ATPase GspE/PulE/Tfp pilus assembly ATPase PilB-like protein